jgi:2-methylcitrate dehydratase
VQVFFRDGSQTDKVAVEYPIGHRRRREEAVPLLVDKLVENLSGHYADRQSTAIVEAFRDPARLDAMRVQDLVDLFV